FIRIAQSQSAGLSAPPSNSFPRPSRACSTIRSKGAGVFKGRLLHESRRQTVDFRTDPPTLNPSEWVLTFADGDQLSVSFHGIGTPDQTNAAFVRLSGRGTITGGT